jgi:signal transduction histidine kinase
MKTIPVVEETAYYGIEELRSDRSPVGQVRTVLDNLRATTGIETNLRVSYVWPSRIPVAVADHLSVIVEEAVENIRLHGTAANVEIQLGADVDAAFLVVREDGKRSAWSRRVPEQDAALGAIQERAARLSSSVEVIESDAGGSKLRIVLPPW